MGWFGKLTFGTVGLLFAGPLGAIAGAALGHHLMDKENDNREYGDAFRPVEQTQAAYFVCMFSILGKLAKADGAVNREEIKIVESFLGTLQIPEQEKQFARRIFNEAMNSPYSIDDFAEQLYKINSNNSRPVLLQSFMDLLFKMAAADGSLHRDEEAALLRIRDIFRISEQQFNNIKAVYFKDTDRFYKILSCTPSSSNQDIKSSYKKLVKDFHPDTVISKGLPEEFIQFATGRFQEIQEAYEKIRKERSF
jgi:DnaJ like chaperone protein